MNEKTTQGNQALQVLNKSELLGRQFTVYGTAENPLFKAADISHELIKRISDEIVNNSLCELDFKGI